jgi:hypothetical protein
MKALSVQQPYAYKIIFERKDIENRTWRTNFRGTVAIHASMKFHPDAEDLSDKQKKKLVRGAIIGVVDVVDCVEEHKSKWFGGPIGFVLKNPRPLKEPIPCKGKLNFWDVPPKIEREIKGMNLGASPEPLDPPQAAGYVSLKGIKRQLKGKI